MSNAIRRVLKIGRREDDMNMDRRAFLSGSAALGAVLAMPGLAETQEISLPPQPSRYPDDAWSYSTRAFPGT